MVEAKISPLIYAVNYIYNYITSVAEMIKGLTF